MDRLPFLFILNGFLIHLFDITDRGGFSMGYLILMLIFLFCFIIWLDYGD